MGEQVLSGDNNNSKHQMVASTVVAASVAIGAGELVVWVGSTVLATKNQVQIITTLKRIRDALIENHSVKPASTFEVVGLAQLGDTKAGVAITNQAALPTITEADLLIGYGETYLDSAGTSKLLQDRIDAAINQFIESDLKAA